MLQAVLDLNHRALFPRLRSSTMDRAVKRREFLKRSALTIAGGILASADSAGAAPAGNLPIVDTHQHLWDLNRFRLRWIEAGTPLAHSFVMRDYLQATTGLNVVKAIYMEVDVAPEQQVAEAEYILDVCRQGNTPTVAAVISGRPAAEGFGAYLMRFRGNRHLKGVRQVLHGAGTPAGYCLEANFMRGIRLLGERGLRFDLCMRPAELGDAVRLIEACPDTRFILDHCGNANVQARDRTQWQRDIARVARCRNVVGKVSGIVVTARAGQWTADDLAPIVNHTLDVFGPERVMFGGDWPVCTKTATYRQWVEALKQIVRNRPVADQRKLFHDNAVRFYGLA
jgi:L-fuconolactonase